MASEADRALPSTLAGASDGAEEGHRVQHGKQVTVREL